MNRALVLLFYFFSVSCFASAKIVLMRNNITRSFDDIEANFARSVKSTGEIGVVYVAEPLDACQNLINEPKQSSNETSPFVLIVRGGCSFEDKVRKAQKAGFKAAIIHDNEDRGILVAMAGNSGGIRIHAVFVTKETGEALKESAGLPDTKVWLLPSFENSAWSIMAVSFISLLAMSAVLATCFFVRRHRIRRRTTSRSSRVREFHGMSRRLVKAMPSLIFSSFHEDNTTAFTCAICLEDYTVGDKLRLLPCCHKFHAACVDSWLTSWRTFCPVCKRDARRSTGEAMASSSTPLLSSAASSFNSSSLHSSVRSSALLIGPSIGSFPTSISFSPAHASSSFIRQSFRSSSLRRSPPINVTRSSMDLRQQGASPSPSPSPSPSQRSYISHMASAQSLGYPTISPLQARYMSPYRPSPSNASPAFVASSSNYPSFHPLRYSESAGTFSPYASANSLPDC